MGAASPVSKERKEPLPRIAHYSVLLELARGGMAQVYIAQRDGSKDVCVLKKLHADLEGLPEVTRRFHREAALVSHLRHPNIARVLDAGMQDKQLYIVLEYIAGVTVEQLGMALVARKQRFPIDTVIAMASRVLDALDYAHALKSTEGKALHLVHRDLTPRNVMVSHKGDVKIIDFGVAHGEIDDYRTEPGLLLGTLRYFSPEQAHGWSIDARSDLYTLSVVLWELLSGRPMVVGATAAEMLIRVTEGKPAALGELDPLIPHDLEWVVARGLHKDPLQRWQTAGEMRQALLEAVPLTDPPEKLLVPLMRALFPMEERRMTRLIADARARLPYDPSRPIAPLTPLEPTEDEASTKTAVAPTALDESSEGSVTRPTEPEITDVTAHPTEVLTKTAMLDKTSVPYVPDTRVVITSNAWPPQASATPVILAGLAFVLVMGIAAALAARMFGEKHEVAPPPIMFAEDFQEVEPGVQARETETEPEPIVREEDVAPVRKALPVKKRVEESHATGDPRLVAIEAKLKALQGKPDDLDQVAELHKLVNAAAQGLSSEEQERVRALVAKSVRAQGALEPIERAIQILRAAHRQPE